MSMADDFLLRRPEIDAADAERLTRAHWGVDAAARELGSQQDRNYALIGADARLLLKIHHPSTAPGEIDLQIAVSRHLAAHGIPTPGVLPTVAGDATVAVVDAAGDTATARAIELIKASALSEDDALDGATYEALGAFAGSTVAALADFAHPAADRSLQWEARRALDVIEALVDYLPEDRRDHCLSVSRAAARLVEAVASGLPLQIIHADLTTDNVLRGADGRFWLIDLGDVCVSWRVAEIAVLAADVLGRTGSLTLTARAVRGFAARVELTDDELQALWPLVQLRGAVLAVSGWSQLSIDPDNHYARERVEHEWKVFADSAAIPVETATSAVRLAAGRPHRRGVSYSPLVDELGGAVVLDLGIDSPLLDNGRWTDLDAESGLVGDALAHAPVAVARFGEARLTRVPWDVSAPAAARARFVQVWAADGCAVHAPFAGTLIRDGAALVLEDAGILLHLEGVTAASAGDAAASRVNAGEVIGHITDARTGIRVTRRTGSGSPVAPFGYPDDEFETDEAADPSVVLGIRPADDPVGVLHGVRRARDRAMGGASERYYVEPPQIERGWDTRLVDTRGRAYLDMVNNVTAVGHCHPVFAERVSRQLHLLNTNSRFLYDAYARFTEKLLARFGDDGFDTVLPVNSGSEAVDLALRVAMAATGRRDVIALREGYHGWTVGADAVTTSAFDNPAALATRPDWVHLADAPNTYRGPHRGADSAAAYAGQVADLAADLVSRRRPPAAFISEPVLGNAGGVVPPDGYLPAVYDAVRAHGGLAIADEVQVGYGRLGEEFWGFRMLGAVPDIVAVAKAAGNAYPLGAVVTRREIADALREEGMFFSSAGGAPAGSVAGEAVLDIIEQQGLQANARRVGDHLRARLDDVAERHPIIGHVHGRGLYLGVELVRDALVPATEETAEICERLLDEGIIMQATSERSNVLKIKPPLTLTVEDADVFVAALDRVLQAVPVRSGQS